MRIITWNCNGAFRKKFNYIAKFSADIYVIQECENPFTSKDIDYKNWATNYLWIGDRNHKGLAVFVREDLPLIQLDWSNVHDKNKVKHFLPCLVNNDIQIIAVWTHQNNSPTFGYIGQLWKYLQVNKKKFNKSILLGDFNSNVFWDKKSRWWNHSNVVSELEEMGIISTYHNYNKEEQGKETQHTFFLHKKIEKGYHIDYCFTSKEFKENLSIVTVGSFDEWMQYSDHVPVIIDLLE